MYVRSAKSLSEELTSPKYCSNLAEHRSEIEKLIIEKNKNDVNVETGEFDFSKKAKLEIAVFLSADCNVPPNDSALKRSPDKQTKK
jgi:hypothetical protein